MPTVKNAQEAVEIVSNQAVLASIQTTFAVGGAIIDNATGNVICAMHNNVLMPFHGSTLFLPHDPTAHGERQLVDWYYANRECLGLPAPSQLTIVTTLDPCAMCAGALMTAGFNVGVAAIDTYAGVNYNEQFDFPSFPPAVRKEAQAKFGYYAVVAPRATPLSPMPPNSPLPRPYVGSDTTVFAGEAISAQSYFLTSSIFDASVNTVREESNNSGLAPDQMSNPAQLPAGAPVRQALTALYPQSLSLTVPNPRMPGRELAEPLVEAALAAQKAGAAFNAVAMLDPFGNLLLCLGGMEQDSPIRTAFMEVTRSYAEMRWALMNDPRETVRAQAEATLTHPKYGTFVFLEFPDPRTAQAVMTLGAYGSTMEGPIPQSFPSNLQYVNLPPKTTQAEVAELAINLPPFYTSSVQVAPQQVLDQGLQFKVAELLAEYAKSK